MKTVQIFTDGACQGNPGKGGWGVLLRYHDQEKTLSGAEAETTNNRMEMMAAIQGLEALKYPCQVKLITDSQYLKKGITEWITQWQRKNWQTRQKKPVKNKDLWLRLLDATKKHQVQWQWVKGHSGHVENERVDQLAREAILKLESEES